MLKRLRTLKLQKCVAFDCLCRRGKGGRRPSVRLNDFTSRCSPVIIDGASCPRGGVGMTFRRSPSYSILVLLLIVAMADRASARIWYGEGVHGYGCYGSGPTERGNFGDSAGSDTG